MGDTNCGTVLAISSSYLNTILLVYIGFSVENDIQAHQMLGERFNLRVLLIFYPGSVSCFE